jgi:hypothetical protein
MRVFFWLGAGLRADLRGPSQTAVSRWRTRAQKTVGKKNPVAENRPRDSERIALTTA